MKKLAILVLLLLLAGVLFTSGYQAQVSMPVGVEVTENPKEAMLGYETYSVTLTQGEESEATPIKLYNNFPVDATIVSLTVIDNAGISVESFSPATIHPSNSKGTELSVTYSCSLDAATGTYPVAHQLVANIDSAHVELTFDVSVTVNPEPKSDSNPEK